MHKIKLSSENKNIAHSNRMEYLIEQHRRKISESHLIRSGGRVEDGTNWRDLAQGCLFRFSTESHEFHACPSWIGVHS